MRMMIAMYVLIYLWIDLQQCRGFTDEDYDNLRSDMAKKWKFPPNKKLAIDNFKTLVQNLTSVAQAGRQYQVLNTCNLCKIAVTAIKLRNQPLESISVILCEIVSSLMALQVSSFCRELVEVNRPILKYILDHNRNITPDYACAILVPKYQCTSDHPEYTWTIEVPQNQPRIPEVDVTPNKKPLKILYFTDFHISSDYEAGGVINCGYPVCCKKGLGNALLHTEKAGRWGDYKCDIPESFVKSTIDHITGTHKDLDFVYFTGDVVDHSVWRASKSANSHLLRTTYRRFLEAFPNIPVLNILGNHEPAPLNVFAPSDPEIEQAGLSTQWLYDLAAEEWRIKLPTKEIENIKSQGYYTYTVNDKLKLIALNNNLCYNFNWWLLLQTSFLKEQLYFLRNELLDSEQKGQFVHILAHIPPGGGECIKPWEDSYIKLVKRFSHIIKGQFYGHTHYDELKIFYNGNVPINVGYNGGSLTPYTDYNPNYKIMTIDSNTYEILDIHTYAVNLDHANNNSHHVPQWYGFSSMKKVYGLPNFSPKSLDNLVHNMFLNDTLSKLYYRLYVRDGRPSLEAGCDRKCITEKLCEIVTAVGVIEKKEYYAYCNEPLVLREARLAKSGFTAIKSIFNKFIKIL